VKANAGPKRNRKKLLKYNGRKKNEYIEKLPLPLPPVKAKRRGWRRSVGKKRARGRKRGGGRGVGERGLEE